jgi:TNF receptor-associated factor 4
MDQEISATQKAKAEKGYDHKFVDSVPNELFCLICLLAARDPQQTTCCGKVYRCETCIDDLKKHSSRCPGCRGDMNCFPDKRSKLDISRGKISLLLVVYTFHNLIS